MRPVTGAGVTAFLLLSASLHAQSTTLSPAPEAVSVSIYRAPERMADEAIETRAPRGYALITETRRVAIAAGDATLRFEGVASGILPESAIVTGLPEGVVEKNQDANLLSPASLLGASSGRRVTLRRTSKATGVVREQSAVIRSGPQGQVVLQTELGFEALRCTGLPETIIYDALPDGLSAKPVLSVRTRSPRAATAMVTLSYLADAFDWQASYVATLAPDGRGLALFGWVTLASGDSTSFRAAQTAVVAGRANRTASTGTRALPEPAIDLTCWPGGTTSDVGMPFPPPPPPPPAAMMADMARAESIVVTGSRRKFATQEDLGDLKLYRLPERVTVAARAQKQVALLERARVPIQILYRADVDIGGGGDGGGGDGDAPVRLTLLARNRAADGLGVALPAGKFALYQRGPDRVLLLGEGAMSDKAVGEAIEIDIAAPTGVVVRNEKGRVTASNANPYAVAVEVRFGDRPPAGLATRLARRDGRLLWAVTVPANAAIVLR